MPRPRLLNATSPPKDGGRSAYLAALPEHEVLNRLADRKQCRELLDLFRTGSPSEKEALQETFRSLGRSSTKLLCQGLKHPEPEARAAVAEILGEVGDRGALEPLADALKESLTGRSAWQQVAMGILWLLSVPVAASVILALMCFSKGALGVDALVWALYGYPRALLTARSRFGSARASIAGALAHVVERHPTPEVLDVLSELKLLSLDLVLQDGKSRLLSRDAARRIDAVTARLRSLPVAVEAQPDTEATLPVPAYAPDLPAASLPVSPELSAESASEPD